MERIVKAVWNTADREQAKRIQYKVQKKREQGSDKNFKELIEEEKRKELSIKEG